MLVIEKKQINNWLLMLNEKFEVFAPRVSREKEVVFARLNEAGEIILGYDYTLMPPKEFFLPGQETIFIKEARARDELQTAALPRPFILFGLNMPDLEGLTQLDEIMKKPKLDYFYWQRRKQGIVIGLTNEILEIEPGGDLILEKINAHQYQARILTDAGKKIVQSNFFREIKQPKIKQNKSRVTNLRKLLVDSELLAEAVEWSWQNNSQVWQDLGKICLGCGICTYVCPLCYCFEVEDRISLDGQICRRCRNWDACTLPRFAQIAGGHNFHFSLKERYYNWFYHKFARGYKEYGKSLCVGCRRCQKYCPAKIDIEIILEKIIYDYQCRQGTVKKYEESIPPGTC